MKIAILSGSHREAETHRIAHFIEDKLKAEFKVETFLYSLANNPMPLWDESAWDDSSEVLQKFVSPLVSELEACDDLIVCVPEWSGMAPAGLKNLLLYLTGGCVAFKPAYLVGVSSSRGGSYPIAELRMSSYKNSQIFYLPEHLIVRYCEHMFHDDYDDVYVRERLDYGLGILLETAKLLQPLRNSGLIDLEKYPYGM